MNVRSSIFRIIFSLCAVAAVVTLVLLLSSGTQLVQANAPTNAVSGTTVVPKTCYASISNTAITFGGSAGVSPGAQSSVNTIGVNQIAGNVNANIYVKAGGDWTGAGSNTFKIDNTIWSNTLAMSLKTAISSSFVDTLTIALASSAATNNIYFAVNVPNGQSADTYTQTITMETSC